MGTSLSSLSDASPPVSYRLLKPFGMYKPGDFLEPLSQARSMSQQSIRTAAVEPTVADRRQLREILPNSKELSLVFFFRAHGTVDDHIRLLGHCNFETQLRPLLVRISSDVDSVSLGDQLIEENATADSDKGILSHDHQHAALRSALQTCPHDSHTPPQFFQERFTLNVTSSLIGDRAHRRFNLLECVYLDDHYSQPGPLQRGYRLWAIRRHADHHIRRFGDDGFHVRLAIRADTVDPLHLTRKVTERADTDKLLASAQGKKGFCHRRGKRDNTLGLDDCFLLTPAWETDQESN